MFWKNITCIRASEQTSFSRLVESILSRHFSLIATIVTAWTVPCADISLKHNRADISATLTVRQNVTECSISIEGVFIYVSTLRGLSLSAVLSNIFFSIHSSSAHYSATVLTSSSLPSRPSFFFPLHIASPWTVGRDGASDDVKHPNSPLNLPPNKRTSSVFYHNLVAIVFLTVVSCTWWQYCNRESQGICHFSLLRKYNHFMTCCMQCTSITIERMVHNNIRIKESAGQWGCKNFSTSQLQFVADTKVYMRHQLTGYSSGANCTMKIWWYGQAAKRKS